MLMIFLHTVVYTVILVLSIILSLFIFIIKEKEDESILVVTNIVITFLYLNVIFINTLRGSPIKHEIVMIVLNWITLILKHLILERK